MSFQLDYGAARADFIAAARQAGASLSEFEHPETGPTGQSLFTDVAWIGPKQAENVLVLVSGTHGIEGITGSGIQTDWLSRGGTSLLPKTMAVLLIHAINPWGFAWQRRVTHENVDLNRNWIDFSAPLPLNAPYSALADILLPERWDEATPGSIRHQLMAHAMQHGLAAVTAAVSGGQYEHPEGLFFGGSEPTWSRRTLAEILTTCLASARHVGIIDYHTGLGPNGFGEYIVSVSSRSPAAVRAGSWYGPCIRTAGDAGSSSATISGDWVGGAQALLPNAEVTGVALEFGTRPSPEVLEALIADNWLHARGDCRSVQAAPIKAAMCKAFYSDNDMWRGMVVGQSLHAVGNAVSALSAASA